MVDQTLQGTLLSYLWNPWVQVLAWLGPEGTATMAVGVTISMAIIGAFIYIAFRYFIIERFAKAAGGGGYGGGINEDTNYKISLFLAVIFTFLMVYSGAMLIIAPLMVGMGGIIGVMVLVMLLLILVGFTRRGFAISKEIGAENAKMRAGASMNEAEAMKMDREAKQAIATEQAEDTQLQKTTADTIKMEEELGKHVNAETKMLAFVTELENMLNSVNNNLTRMPILDEPTANRLQALAGELFKDDQVVLATEVKGVEANTMTGELASIEKLMKDTRKRTDDLRVDMKKTKPTIEKEMKEVERIVADLKKWEADPAFAAKKAIIDTALKEAEQTDKILKDARAKLAEIDGLDKDIETKDTALIKRFDEYKNAEVDALKRFTAEEINRIATARGVVTNLLGELKPVGYVRGHIARSALSMLTSTSTINEKRTAIKRVLLLLAQLRSILGTLLVAGKEFLRKQDNLKAFLQGERINDVNKLEPETKRLFGELEKMRTDVFTPHLTTLQNYLNQIVPKGGAAVKPI
jgi:hypothetical protein